MAERSDSASSDSASSDRASSIWRRARTRVVAYVRVSSEGESDDGALWQTEAGAAQVRSIEDWTRAHEGEVVSIAAERAPSGLEHTADRVGFLSAISQVRDGKADAIGVASLAELDEDVVVQELLLEEARRTHVELLSADPADERQLCDPPTDAARALVRRVIQDVPRFQGEMRSLRAWMRRSEGADELLGAALAELESLQEHGSQRVDDMSSRRLLRDGAHRIASLLRSRRSPG